MERELTISTADLEILIEALNALEKRYKANAERTKSGYGSCASQTKREEYIAKAEAVWELNTRISYEFI